MGLFDIFSGGTPQDRALKLKPKATQKYGEAAARQKALTALAEMKTPEAVSVLMNRFTFSVDPQTTDLGEKNDVFEAIVALGPQALTPVKDFLRKSDQASSWAVRLLDTLLPPDDAVGVVCEMLKKFGAEYTRDPEKKIVLLQYLEGKTDARVPEVVLPLLADVGDDVKIAALKTLSPHKHEPARETMLELLIGADTGKRVQTAVIQALHESAFTVQGYREKVEARLSDPWFVDKAGAIKKRG